MISLKNTSTTHKGKTQQQARLSAADLQVPFTCRGCDNDVVVAAVEAAGAGVAVVVVGGGLHVDVVLHIDDVDNVGHHGGGHLGVLNDGGASWVGGDCAWCRGCSALGCGHHGEGDGG